MDKKSVIERELLDKELGEEMDTETAVEIYASRFRTGGTKMAKVVKNVEGKNSTGKKKPVSIVPKRGDSKPKKH